jgi:hypothetical protein
MTLSEICQKATETIKTKYPQYLVDVIIHICFERMSLAVECWEVENNERVTKVKTKSYSVDESVFEIILAEVENKC